MERRRQPRHSRKRSNQRLVSYVEGRLRADWSPEAITGRLRRDYAEDEQMRIGAETVYHWVYRDVRQGGVLYTRLHGQHNEAS